MDIDLRLPNGEVLTGSAPVVVVGPNGSGKTRQTRSIVTASGVAIDVVNALRNTRVAPELPAMGRDTARTNFAVQKQNSRNFHWELAGEFDMMLSQLLAESAGAAIEFTRRFRDNSTTAGLPVETAMTRVEDLWAKVFPGRSLRWDEMKPMVSSVTAGSAVRYSGNQMSDGEKAALYLAGRVFSTEPATALIVDEPETHLHSLLAIRLWDALEAARPDVRFIYITHDLTFAMSRRSARYVLASPTAGLRAIDLGDEVPSDVAEALLGSASLSFYASRVVFCEGEDSSYDRRLYGAWFNGLDTVVRAVGSSQRVLRCVDALTKARLARSLEAVGIIDRDYYGAVFLKSLPRGVQVLAVHEIESLFAIPTVVQAVSAHLSRKFLSEEYLDRVIETVSAEQKEQLIIRRWKASIEPYLTALVASTGQRHQSVSQLIVDLPTLFDMNKWSFSPEGLLEAEGKVISNAFAARDESALFALLPGKPLLPLAAQQVGMTVEAYTELVVSALLDSNKQRSALTVALETALTPYLPPRIVAIADGALLPSM